jgi:60 kDa SS-A/Ro ribonucleoprotein
MFKFTRFFSTKTTPQSEPIPGTHQVPNSAGGHAWQLDDWARLDRFLVLGCEGGTYYVGERELTIENAKIVQRCIAADGVRTIDRIVAISDAGRAPKNDPAIFSLAMAAKLGDEPTRRAAYAALSKVCRIGTHLMLSGRLLTGWTLVRTQPISRLMVCGPTESITAMAIFTLLTRVRVRPSARFRV